MRFKRILAAVAAASLGGAAVAAAAGGTPPGGETGIARPVGAGGVCWQLGASALLEVGVGLAGYGLMHGSLSGWGTSDDTHGGNAPAFFVGLGLFAAYPLAAAVGTYLAGEKVGGPAANKGETFGVPTLAAYGQTFLFVGAAAAVRAVDNDVGEEAYGWAVAADAATKPVLTTYVYHKVKRPASEGESRLAVEPYVSTAAASEGRPVPVYGVTVSF